MSNKDKDYLPFLRDPPKIEGEVPKDWYARASEGLQELRARLEAERELKETLERAAPEIQQLMMVELLSAAPLPSPTAALSASGH